MRCLRTLPLQLEGTIEIIQPPHKTDFYTYEPIDMEGMVILVTPIGRPSVTVDWRELDVSPKYFTYPSEGEYLVSINYRTMYNHMAVNIMPQEITSIEVKSSPQYMFSWGDEFHRGDIVVEGIFEHFGRRVLDESELTFSIPEGTPLHKSHTELVISYGDVTASLPITVSDKVTGAVLNEPSKKTYVYGDRLDVSDATISVIYNGEEDEYADVKTYRDMTITPKQGTRLYDAGRVDVTLSYESFSFTIGVSVSHRFEGIEIHTEPSKTSYAIGEELDYTGAVVRRVYDDETYHEISEIYDISPTVLTEDMVNPNDDSFDYTLRTEDGDIGGKMYWNGSRKIVINFMDWVPWYYQEGFDIWNSDPSVYVYGWEDSDGNRIQFPYSVYTSVSHTRNDWGEMGMHPLYDVGVPSQPNVWVHGIHMLSTSYSYSFVGSDSTTWDLGYNSDNVPNCPYTIDTVYLPYLDGDFKMGIGSNLPRCIYAKKFHPFEKSEFNGSNEEFHVYDSIRMRSWKTEYSENARSTSGELYTWREVYWYATIHDGAHQQIRMSPYMLVEWNPVDDRRVWKWHWSFEDGWTWTSRKVTRYNSYNIKEESMSHVFSPSSRMPRKCTVYVHNIEPISLDWLSPCANFVKKVIVPLEGKGLWLQEYPTGTVDGRLPIEFEEISTWVPPTEPIDGWEYQWVNFKDWVPWACEDGYRIWNLNPKLVVYGWRDSYGNVVKFPYKVHYELNKYDWQTLGITPMYAIWSPPESESDIESNALYGQRNVWVHSMESVPSLARYDRSYKLDFVGSDYSDLDGWRGEYPSLYGQNHSPTLVDVLYLPYTTYTMNVKQAPMSYCDFPREIYADKLDSRVSSFVLYGCTLTLYERSYSSVHSYIGQFVISDYLERVGRPNKCVIRFNTDTPIENLSAYFNTLRARDKISKILLPTLFEEEYRELYPDGYVHLPSTTYIEEVLIPIEFEDMSGEFIPLRTPMFP